MPSKETQGAAAGRSSSGAPVQPMPDDDGRYDLANGAGRRELEAWMFARFEGTDPWFGFGRSGEDRDAPYLLVRSVYRNGTPQLRTTLLDEVALPALRRLARGNGDYSDAVARGLLMLVNLLASHRAGNPLIEIVKSNRLIDRANGEELTDLAFTTLGALLVEQDQEFWKEQIQAHPRAAAIQAAVRTIGFQDLPRALDFLVEITTACSPEFAAAAGRVATILPMLLRWWREADPERHTPQNFLDEVEPRVERLPEEARGPFESMLATIRKRYEITTHELASLDDQYSISDRFTLNVAEDLGPLQPAPLWGIAA